eukprot:2642139-Prymnesium_polylepis.1
MCRQPAVISHAELLAHMLPKDSSPIAVVPRDLWHIVPQIVRAQQFPKLGCRHRVESPPLATQEQACSARRVTVREES